MKKTKVIRMYNELLNYKLKASEFKIYIYFTSFFWWKHRICVKLETMPHAAT